MIELISVAGIKQRTGSLTAAGAAVFLRQVTVSAVMGDFVIQQMHADDYETAARLLSVYSPHHDLRTLDSLHLACALRLRARRGVDFFVTADRVLANVANLEGFAIIIPDEA